jgi:hypothetical protein
LKAIAPERNRLLTTARALALAGQAIDGTGKESQYREIASGIKSLMNPCAEIDGAPEMPKTR